MTDQSRRRQTTDDDVGRSSEHGPTGPTRGRWVIVLWIVVAIAVLALIVFLHLSGTIGPGVHRGG